jgi:hypothetical protein
MEHKMSDDEKFKIQGRAHAALKTARSEAGHIKAALRDYAHDIDEVSRLIALFINDPLNTSLSGIPLSPHLKNLVEAMTAEGTKAAALVGELADTTKRIQELEAQISEF